MLRRLELRGRAGQQIGLIFVGDVGLRRGRGSVRGRLARDARQRQVGSHLGRLGLDRRLGIGRRLGSGRGTRLDRGGEDRQRGFGVAGDLGAATGVCCAACGANVSAALSAAVSTAAPWFMAVTAAAALPRASCTCSAAWAAISRACCGRSDGATGNCAATARAPASAWAAVCTASLMAPAAAPSAVAAGSPGLPSLDGVLLLPFAGRASAAWLGRCCAGRCCARTSEKAGPLSFLFPAAGLAPSTSLTGDGEAGAIEGKGRGAVI